METKFKVGQILQRKNWDSKGLDNFALVTRVGTYWYSLKSLEGNKGLSSMIDTVETYWELAPESVSILFGSKRA